MGSQAFKTENKRTETSSNCDCCIAGLSVIFHNLLNSCTFFQVLGISGKCFVTFGSLRHGHISEISVNIAGKKVYFLEPTFNRVVMHKALLAVGRFLKATSLHEKHEQDVKCVEKCHYGKFQIAKISIEMTGIS